MGRVAVCGILINILDKSDKINLDFSNTAEGRDGVVRNFVEVDVDRWRRF